MRNYTPTTQPFYAVKSMIVESGVIGPTGPTGPAGSGSTGSGASSINELTDASLQTNDIYHQIYIGQKAPETIDPSINVLVIGKDSLQLNTYGDENTVVGYHSLSENTEGSNNTALGNYTLQHNVDSSQNVAVGNYALQNNTVGSRNTAVGYQSLNQNMTGSYNTALGRRALESLTIGDGNTVIGYRALQNPSEGNYNTFIGSYTSTGYDMELGIDRQLSNAIAIGYQATATITGGLFFPGTNTGEDFIGYSLAEVANSGSSTRAVIYNSETGQMGPISSTGSIGNLSSLSDAKNILYEGEGTFSQVLSVGSTLSEPISNGEYDTSSLKMIAIGYDALRNNITGTHNIAIGGDALRFNTTGSNNIAVGVRALDICYGSNNVAIGDNSLNELENSNNNTAVGSLTRVVNGASDTIVIGKGAVASITGGLFFPGVDYDGVPIAPLVGNTILNVAYNPESGQLGTRTAIHTRYTTFSSPPEGTVAASTDPVYPIVLPPSTFSVFVIEDDGVPDDRTFYFKVPTGYRAELLILNNDVSGDQNVLIMKDDYTALRNRIVPSQNCCYCNIVGDLIAYMDVQSHT